LNQSSPPAPEPYGGPRHYFIRYGIRFFVSCYLRIRKRGFDKLPEAPYLLCFNHPNWVDPFLLAAYWPEPPRLYIFGPKEEDMGAGWKNRLIGWSGMAVPFKPSKSDLLETTRRAVAVLKRGDILAIAGEGRLSDREGAIVPLQEGAAFFALRARVPIVPLAITGTRWLSFGKRVALSVGDPLSVEGLKPDREGLTEMTARITNAMDALLAGDHDDKPPGPFGRWLTDVFNDRPWLNRSG
jgi:1-acyl-sn-glycerol-3-phosphate acyltransferase